MYFLTIKDIYLLANEKEKFLKDFFFTLNF